MRTPTTCTKCEGSLTAGFIVDQAYGSNEVSTWQEGHPKPVWYGGVKMRKAEQMEVTTYRCDRCGALESYALSL